MPAAGKNHADSLRDDQLKQSSVLKKDIDSFFELPQKFLFFFFMFLGHSGIFHNRQQTTRHGSPDQITLQQDHGEADSPHKAPRR